MAKQSDRESILTVKLRNIDYINFTTTTMLKVVRIRQYFNHKNLPSYQLTRSLPTKTLHM